MKTLIISSPYVLPMAMEKDTILCTLPSRVITWEATEGEGEDEDEG